MICLIGISNSEFVDHVKLDKNPKPGYKKVHYVDQLLCLFGAHSNQV